MHFQMSKMKLFPHLHERLLFCKYINSLPAKWFGSQSSILQVVVQQSAGQAQKAAPRERMRDLGDGGGGFDTAHNGSHDCCYPG